MRVLSQPQLTLLQATMYFVAENHPSAIRIRSSLTATISHPRNHQQPNTQSLWQNASISPYGISPTNAHAQTKGWCASAIVFSMARQIAAKHATRKLNMRQFICLRARIQLAIGWQSCPKAKINSSFSYLMAFLLCKWAVDHSTLKFVHRNFI